MIFVNYPMVVEKEMQNQLMSDYLDLLRISKERPSQADRGELFLLFTPLELSAS
jgi:hypothetical protein